LDSEQLIFNAAGATGTGTVFTAIDRQHVVLTLSSSGSATYTIKFQGSNSDTKPDFSASRTVANRWEYIQVKDLQNAAAIDGDTGVAYTTTDDVRMFELNTNRLKWVCATLTVLSAGAVTLSAL